MVTNQQVRKLMKLIDTEPTLAQAADKAGMSERTARKYRKSGQLPGDCQKPRDWRTREDPFGGVWDELLPLLEMNPGLEAKTLFEHLQRCHPGRFQDGQLRTLQRKVKRWRALEGPAKEVFFPQVHEPGRLCESDFCHLTRLGITLGGQPFPHLLYHFVLTYSNWETGCIASSESFESLSEGFQKAVWELGGVPQRHRIDRMGAAVRIEEGPGGTSAFHERYQSLLDHYGLIGEKIQAGRPNENGDVEQRHRRFVEALDQALMLRGSRDFDRREEYERFLREMFARINRGRSQRLGEEKARLRPLPGRSLDACLRLKVRVNPASTIRVQHNTYSVHSRLIGERVEVRLYADRLEVWYAQQRVEALPRIRGRQKVRIEYRHLIDWLVRKPGAFEHYRYREELFPSGPFRLAYDALRSSRPETCDREYLRILWLAAKRTESGVEAVLRTLLLAGSVSGEAVERGLAEWGPHPSSPPSVRVAAVDLRCYDGLLSGGEALAAEGGRR